MFGGYVAGHGRSDRVYILDLPIMVSWMKRIDKYHHWKAGISLPNLWGLGPCRPSMDVLISQLQIY